MDQTPNAESSTTILSVLVCPTILEIHSRVASSNQFLPILATLIHVAEEQFLAGLETLASAHVPLNTREIPTPNASQNASLTATVLTTLHAATTNVSIHVSIFADAMLNAMFATTVPFVHACPVTLEIL